MTGEDGREGYFTISHVPSQVVCAPRIFERRISFFKPLEGEETAICVACFFVNTQWARII
jgi:hypothetical protein